ncbi:tetratricopeptide repeat protein [Undibacterium sp. WLHG33]|uniref:tetratricopeptide repeat protein n=1 Tax=Undibacterium sp. WLHG33 TaxID=3412482 RepID=UPI003C2D2A7D
MANFNPVTFEPHFRALVADTESDLELDEIDDALQQATPKSDGARACAYLAAEILSSADRPWSQAYALNTAVGASCMAGDTERARRYLKQLVDLTIETGTDLPALSAVENVRLLLPGNAKADHVPNILYEVVRLYRHLGKVEKAIENLIIAAYLFADFGAFQPAYGALVEAENLARDNQLLQEYADVVSTIYAICLLEGDHAYAEKMWPTLKQKYVELGRPVPAHLAANRATLLFQTGDYLAARKAFEELLADVKPGDGLEEGRTKILINLSACLRELGEHALSDVRMAEARRLLSTLENVDPEHQLEMELIAAKNAVVEGDLVEACSCLNRAAQSLNAGVGLVEKLHYRRGLRERYVPRVERLLASLATIGRAADVIPVVAATRANRVSDWLYFLEWAEMLAAMLSPEEKEELDGLVDHLARHGSPHLFGYLEKYDDPMSAIKMPDPWRDIAEYADKINARHGFRRPFQNATSESITRTIVKRLDEGYAILVNMVAADNKMLLLISDRYVFCDLPQAETRVFFEALLRHRLEPNQAKAVGLAVGAYQEALLRSLGPVLSELAVESCKGVIFIPDGSNLTPINLIMVGDPKIRARMAAGKFEVRTCIAPYPAKRQAAALSSCLGIIENDSRLLYDRADVKEFFKGVGATGTVLEDPTWNVFAEAMASTDALVLSHHGASIGLFRDAFFADMAGPYRNSAMDLMRLQGEAFRWPHRLAVLGTCHSGDLVNRNYQTRFRTHDLMGFPTVFLLNGRSEVLAASWAILDRFNLLFTTLFAPGLQKAHPSLAASIALAKLFELPKEELSDLVHSAFPADVLNTSAVLEQIDNLRRQPFCYGAYQTYTLL